MSKLKAKDSTFSVGNKTWFWICIASAFLLNIGTSQFDFTLDDPLVVSQNIYVDKGLDGIVDIWTHTNREGYDGHKESNYRPFSISLFAIENQVFGKKPAAHHFVHVLYYVFAVALVFRFLSFVFRSNTQHLAGLITLLFAIHPIHTEVVANLKSRDEITALIGVLISLISCLKFIDVKSVKWLALFILGLGISFFSKESALPLVAIIPITLYFFRSLKSREAFIIYGATAGIALFYFFMRIYVAGTPGPAFTLSENAFFQFTVPERNVAALSLLPRYLFLLIFPYWLTADYSFNQLSLGGFKDPFTYLGLVLAIGLIYFVIKRLAKKEAGMYGILFFGAFYLVTSNIFFLTGATLAERFMFMPSLGFVMAAVYYFNHYIFVDQRRVYGTYALIPFLLFFIFKTLDRNRDFKSNETIYKVTAETSSQSVRALTKYARLLYNKSLTANSNTRSRLMNDALKLCVQSEAISKEYDLTFYVKGLIYLNKGENELALAAFNECRRLVPLRADYVDQTIVTLANLNREPDIEKILMEAQEKDIKSKLIFDAIADRYRAKGEFTKAAEFYEKILKLDAFDKIALKNLTLLYRDDIKNIEKANIYNERLGAASRISE